MIFELPYPAFFSIIAQFWKKRNLNGTLYVRAIKRGIQAGKSRRTEIAQQAYWWYTNRDGQAVFAGGPQEKIPFGGDVYKRQGIHCVQMAVCCRKINLLTGGAYKTTER